MRILLLCLVLFISFGFACSASPADSFMEHADGAGMQCCASLTVYTFNSADSLTAVQKQLPWQTDMAAYALSFALPNADTRYNVAITDGQAVVNISRFPTYASAGEENAAVAAVVNTMLFYPGIESVSLRFDGRVFDKLPRGTIVGSNFISLYCIKITPDP